MTQKDRDRLRHLCEQWLKPDPTNEPEMGEQEMARLALQTLDELWLAEIARKALNPSYVQVQ